MYLLMERTVFVLLAIDSATVHVEWDDLSGLVQYSVAFHRYLSIIVASCNKQLQSGMPISYWAFIGAKLTRNLRRMITSASSDAKNAADE